MKYLELRKRIKANLFSLLDVVKLFPKEDQQLIKTQLHRFSRRGLIKPIKRELYCFDLKQVDELQLASLLYQPSYISLETALNYYGLMPDIPQGVTSIALTTTKTIKNNLGVFYYTKIKKPLFFGFMKVQDVNSGRFFNMAMAEKALLDYIYIRRLRSLSGLRLELKNINQATYNKYARFYPSWVREVVLNE